MVIVMSESLALFAHEHGFPVCPACRGFLRVRCRFFLILAQANHGYVSRGGMGHYTTLTPGDVLRRPAPRTPGVLPPVLTTASTEGASPAPPGADDTPDDWKGIRGAGQVFAENGISSRPDQCVGRLEANRRNFRLGFPHATHSP
jgi:hypothetical protein